MVGGQRSESIARRLGGAELAGRASIEFSSRLRALVVIGLSTSASLAGAWILSLLVAWLFGASWLHWPSFLAFALVSLGLLGRWETSSVRKAQREAMRVADDNEAGRFEDSVSRQSRLERRVPVWVWVKPHARMGLLWGAANARAAAGAWESCLRCCELLTSARHAGRWLAAIDGNAAFDRLQARAAAASGDEQTCRELVERWSRGEIDASVASEVALLVYSRLGELHEDVLHEDRLLTLCGEIGASDEQLCQFLRAYLSETRLAPYRGPNSTERSALGGFVGSRLIELLCGEWPGLSAFRQRWLDDLGRVEQERLVPTESTS